MPLSTWESHTAARRDAVCVFSVSLLMFTLA